MSTRTRTRARPGLTADLGRIVGAGHVLAGSPAPYGEDATGATLGLHGVADAVVRPGSTEEVRRVVAYCHEHDVAMVPRGGGTGFAGGAVPVHGGVVVSLERMDAVRALDPGAWRMHAEAGVRTGTVARRARESGLFFPPNPGAAEQSLIGGNVATNAGGPRAFKYGVTRRWVTGLEVVVAPGEVLQAGGPLRKDVTGYDLVGLFCGSEGTLGVITAVWLSLLPAPRPAPWSPCRAPTPPRAARPSPPCSPPACRRRRSSSSTGAPSGPPGRRSPCPPRCPTAPGSSSWSSSTERPPRCSAWSARCARRSRPRRWTPTRPRARPSSRRWPAGATACPGR
ncbi:FAD-binding protein [Baekduia soli]|uniref:FAD-binding protein n=1 Tax=Baekduia soli TaxID=496014 RepID=A0A5B8U349_9ACTN|nr:FAD-binding protein [Baekduia soli]